MFCFYCSTPLPASHSALLRFQPPPKLARLHFQPPAPTIMYNRPYTTPCLAPPHPPTIVYNRRHNPHTHPPSCIAAAVEHTTPLRVKPITTHIPTTTSMGGFVTHHLRMVPVSVPKPAEVLDRSRAAGAGAGAEADVGLLLLMVLLHTVVEVGESGGDGGGGQRRLL
ncbi:hypothetical protein RIF29_34835 [Crotalaria pallida]|uniref:Uncharacterized protein n=1 Tax=Crotalaria pallida TaxID=3830 RepID=A0AAN9HUV6_CROPI